MDTVLLALSLGLIAGISPGPLMTVVLTTSLERGFRAGALTGLAPLVSDLPVVLLSLAVLGRVPESFLSGVTVAGGLFVAWLGIQTIRDVGEVPDLDTEASASSRDILRGALANLLNPHPWLFWFTVGTPIVIQRWEVAKWESIAFLVIFIGLLVGAKVVLAWGVSKGRRFLGTVWYRRILTVCGVVLIGFGLLLLWQGLVELGLF